MAVLGSTVISGFVTKALTLRANLVDHRLKALLDRGGKPLQVLEGLLRRSYGFGTLNSPLALRTGEIHLADHLTVRAPEFNSRPAQAALAMFLFTYIYAIDV
ncbi:MAG: hypothetical protein ACRERE_04455 [Candidatus Entotheonellia bacterium]